MERITKEDLYHRQKLVNNAYGYKKYALEHYNGSWHIVKYTQGGVCQTTVRGGLTTREAYEAFYFMDEALTDLVGHVTVRS
jgi:uncharacterized membrane protein